ncbi:hypothetical protein F5X98DRAFT_391732 [Xylaria grammica]|nr:hypothetical protein F5X98DRAFT_391732 [Xylaria grammica]
MSRSLETEGPVPCSTEYLAGLQVMIVCSLPRTGTTSVKLSLERLGYHNVYHMSTFVDHIEGHAIGAPSCHFVNSLAEAYPDAKVVILNRDSEEWYGLFTGTVQKLVKHRESLRLLEWTLRPCLPIPASAPIRMGNLLSRSRIGLGSWFPLCQCLGVYAPGQQTPNGWVQAPFSRANDVESFYAYVARIQSVVVRKTMKNIFLYGLVLFGFIVFFIKVRLFTRQHWLPWAWGA